MTMHVMLDLETWGKIPGSDIRSIGAVVFDPVAGTVSHGDGAFYLATDNPVVTVGTVERRQYPLTRDPETVKWWSDQSAEAQAAFADPVDLRKALTLFRDWIIECIDPLPRNNNPLELRLWANDPHFDVSILGAVYRAVQLPEPWHYRAPRSMKTITDAAGMTRDDFRAFDHGTAHNALDDAISQAMIVCEAYKRLGLARSSDWNWK